MSLISQSDESSRKSLMTFDEMKNEINEQGDVPLK